MRSSAHRRTARGLMLLLAVVAVTTACGTEAPPVTAPPAPTTPAPTTPPAPVQARDEGEACYSDKPLATSARPYTGQGPHAVAQHQRTRGPGPTVAGVREAIPRAYVALPDRWDGDPSSQDPVTAPLLACVSAGPPRPTGRTVSCTFSANPFSSGLSSGGPTKQVRFGISDGEYSVTVKETRTGRTVGTFRVPANGPTDDICPYSVTYAEGDSLMRPIDAQAYVRALRPYVEAVR